MPSNHVSDSQTVYLVTLRRLLFEPLSEPCPVNDLSTEEIPLHSGHSLEATSVVTDENVFVDGDVDEEDESASNKFTEPLGMCIICGCYEYHNHCKTKK